MAGIAMAGGGADAQAGSPPCARHRARPALRVRHDGPVRGSRNERAGALQLAARSGPPGLLRDALDRALVEMRAGVPQAVAIRLLARRSGSTWRPTGPWRWRRQRPWAQIWGRCCARWPLMAATTGGSGRSRWPCRRR
ncbi:hypothetical protein WJ968_12635 [Achromobacter xylosoxidans]